MSERESMDVDIIIIGAGPAGLSCAIHLANLAKKNNKELSITILEKAAEVGAHSLAGAVLETRALDELIPDWRDRNSPIKTEVSDDKFVFMSENKAINLPVPSGMHNQGNYIISLGLLVRWLGEQAEALGIEIYSGYAAAEVLYDDNGTVKGVATGETGITKEGEKGPSYDPGMELHAKTTIVAEGCRGSLSRVLIDQFDLDKDAQPSTYAIGLKEIWEIPEAQHQEGKTLHSIGWPLESDTYGGSFLYHLDSNKVSIGFAIGLDYSNPYLNPFKEFQRFKTHPSIRAVLAGGKRLSYGARALTEGGIQSLPKLDFPGGLLIGDAAGFLNVAKIKGIHTAMKSGMLAAEAVVENLESEQAVSYDDKFRSSWLFDELQTIRNIRPGFKNGIWMGLANAALTTYITRGKEPWSLGHHADHEQLKNKNDAKEIDYPAPDGEVSFDILSSVYLSNTNHDENQPVHLHLKDASVAIDTNLALYDSPESRYCPANVYEIVEDGTFDDESGEEGAEAKPTLRINSQNCLHCKTCDIKDPTQNIVWTTPEAGGPLYSDM